jgi:DNA-binding NarL/FixJ family response regulator
MLRIGLVDDHKLFRKSLSLLINSFEDMEVVLEAEDGEEFMQKIYDNPIDIVLLDIQMPKMNGFEVCKILHKKFKKVKILIVSQLTTKECIHKVMELGAHGYFPKNADPDQLETAINSLESVGFYYGMELGLVMKEALLWEKNNPDKAAVSETSLTDREIQIVKMACLEKNSSEIAKALFITVRTVETHRTKIMQKTNSKNFIGVILFAMKYQYLHINDL